MRYEKYSKPDLINELDKTKQELKKANQEIEELNKRNSHQNNKLRERTKELDGIYRISRLINDSDRSLKAVLKEAIEVLSNSYLYADICCGRLFWNDKEFITEGFKETRWKQSTKVALSDNRGCLILEIFYLKEKPELDEGPFLKHERNLLNAVARELSVFLNRRLAERQIKVFSQKLLSIFNSVKDAVFIHDLEGNFIEVNEEACRRLNYSREELLSITPMDIDEKSYAERAPRIFKQLDEQGRYKGETIHVTRDGGKIPTELNSNKIFLEDKPLILTVARDITDRKQYEEELLDAKNKAEESATLKSAFLANLSHEVRTPLNAIMGFTDLLNNEDLEESKRKEFIHTIQQSGNKLLSIIDDILDLSFIESDQVQVDHQEFSMNELLDQVSIKVPSEFEDSQKDIKLKIYKHLGNNQDVVVSDPKIIHHIFDKLMDNALKFTRKGFIEIGYKTEDNAHVSFYVKDSGIGVPEESKELIFERFRQVDNRITRQFEGLGLGLSIAKGLVGRLGGKIELDSTEGEGTTVTFELPVRISEKQEYSGEDSGFSRGVLPDSEQTILIAEDELTNYFLIEEFLRQTGVHIKHAENGAQAVELFKTGEIDLILMDIKMPVLDGIEAFKEIKKLNANIPIIALTAYAYEVDKKGLLDQGFDGYISKPVAQHEVVELIARFRQTNPDL